MARQRKVRLACVSPVVHELMIAQVRSGVVPAAIHFEYLNNKRGAFVSVPSYPQLRSLKTHSKSDITNKTESTSEKEAII